MTPALYQHLAAMTAHQRAYLRRVSVAELRAAWPMRHRDWAAAANVRANVTMLRNLREVAA